MAEVDVAEITTEVLLGTQQKPQQMELQIQAAVAEEPEMLDQLEMVDQEL